jgi:NTE family protein
MTSIALVLGAGGVVGAAYHVGAIAALADAAGWDARRADLIVGTSAGSGVAATLRVGFSPADHYARSQDEEMSDEGKRLGAYIPRERVKVPGPPSFDPLAFLRPAAPWLIAPAFLSPGPFRPGLLAGLLPRGRIGSEVLGERIRVVLQDRWPEPPTWICATRLRDGKRVVFGRDDVDVPDLGTAVQASSAIPSYFEPVRIGDREYIDGATFSPTNADLVARLGYDLVVVVSPMSAVSDASGPSLGAAGRMYNGRTLSREVAQIREAGTPVLVIQPTGDDLAVMRGNPLDNELAPPVARQARESVARYVDDPRVADRVAVLRATMS